MVDELLVPDMDLLTFEDRGNRNDHREFAGVTAKVVGHRHDGSVSVADQHHLGGPVE